MINLVSGIPVYDDWWEHLERVVWPLYLGLQSRIYAASLVILIDTWCRMFTTHRTSAIQTRPQQLVMQGDWTTSKPNRRHQAIFARKAESIQRTMLTCTAGTWCNDRNRIKVSNCFETRNIWKHYLVDKHRSTCPKDKHGKRWHTSDLMSTVTLNRR